MGEGGCIFFFYKNEIHFVPLRLSLDFFSRRARHEKKLIIHVDFRKGGEGGGDAQSVNWRISPSQVPSARFTTESIWLRTDRRDDS